jgi:phosphoribosyl 1,2-cyclic phosphodiesterase
VKNLCKTFQIPLYVTEKVFRNDFRLQDISLHQVFFFLPDSVFQIGKLSFDPFNVSHDAAQTVGITVWDGNDSISIVTDIGEYTDYTVSKVKESQAIIVEANHDEKLLWGCHYPWYVKERIAGPKGHLGNQFTSSFIKEICKKKKNINSKLKYLGAAHISENGNTEELALEALKTGIRDNFEIPHYFIAKQTEASDLFVL